MANEILIRYVTGSTLYAHVLNSTGQIWNGATFETPQNANWLDYDLAMAEAGTTGYYRVSMPAVAAGAYSYTVVLQAGGAPAVADVTVGTGSIQWSGTAEVATNDLATSTALATVDGNVDAILADTGTDGVVVANINADTITAASIAADAITSSELAASAANEIADATLVRGASNIEDTADDTSLGALVLATFESKIDGVAWTIYKTDHSTTFDTRTVTLSGTAQPVVEVT